MCRFSVPIFTYTIFSRFSFRFWSNGFSTKKLKNTIVLWESMFWFGDKTRKPEKHFRKLKNKCLKAKTGRICYCVSKRIIHKLTLFLYTLISFQKFIHVHPLWDGVGIVWVSLELFLNLLSKKCVAHCHTNDKYYAIHFDWFVCQKQKKKIILFGWTNGFRGMVNSRAKHLPKQEKKIHE